MFVYNPGVIMAMIYQQKLKKILTKTHVIAILNKCARIGVYTSLCK